MANNQDTAPATAQEAHLYPCPFCGNPPVSLQSHDAECFFRLSEELKNATGANAFALASRTAEAWKRRVPPPGYKTVPVAGQKGAFDEWERYVPHDGRSFFHNGQRVVINGSHMEQLFPKLMEYVKPYGSPEASPKNGT